MFLSHVSIDTLTLWERLHTHPADVRLAVCTCHMITTFYSFNRYATPGTAFNVVVLHPFLQFLIPIVVIIAYETFVGFMMAGRAYAQKA